MGNAMNALLALVLVVVAIPVVLWAMRTLTRWPATKAGEMRILSSLVVGPRERLLIIEVRGQQLLVGVTSQSVHLITSVSDSGDSGTLAGQGSGTGIQLGAVAPTSAASIAEATAAPADASFRAALAASGVRQPAPSSTTIPHPPPRPLAD